MPAFVIMALMLVTPVGLWAGGEKSAAAFIGLYVLLSMPAMYQITADAIRTRSWPRIVGGPGIRFGKWG